MAKEKLNSMISEFSIASNLQHPNILKYHYFVRQYQRQTQNYEYHILTELLGGKDLQHYI